MGYIGISWSTLCNTAFCQQQVNEQSVGKRVVVFLAHCVLDKFLCINVENFLTSASLSDKLCARNADAVETLRADRR